MVSITLNIRNLNNSLQVGDAVYARATITQPGAIDPQGGLSGHTGINHLVGVLTRISTNPNGTITLDINESSIVNPDGDGVDEIGLVDPLYIPQAGDFIMFSKYSQTDGDIIGYYAQAKFKNNSREKAELFSIGSEVIINSK